MLKTIQSSCHSWSIQLDVYHLWSSQSFENLLLRIFSGGRFSPASTTAYRMLRSCLEMMYTPWWLSVRGGWRDDERGLGSLPFLFDPAATFTLQRWRSNWHYTHRYSFFRTSLPRFTFSSDLLITDPKWYRRGEDVGRRCNQLIWQAMWIFSDTLVFFYFQCSTALGFLSTIPSPCLWRVYWHICQTRRN